MPIIWVQRVHFPVGELVKRTPARDRRSILVLTAIVVSIITFGAACSRGEKEASPQKPAIPVLAATVIEKTIPVQLTGIGNVEAVSTVEIKSQVGGVLQKVHFQEGDDVRKGELLFTIDPRPFERQVEEAAANLAKDKAQLDFAVEEMGRYRKLVEKGYVARDLYEKYRTDAAALEAVVTADQAVLDNARLQLQYCTIYSPVRGRTGNLNINEGNLVKANADTSMVVIRQIQPAYVTFTMPERNLGEIKHYLVKGKLPLAAESPGGEGNKESGELTFIDNAIDPATGTIKMKGIFPNSDRKLWPGQFVNVTLTLTNRPDALLVPASAVLTGQEDQHVFVILKDNTVEFRSVATGERFNDYMVITEGLKAGERVVTDGQMRLVPGAKVEIKKSGTGGEAGPESSGTVTIGAAAGKHS